MEQEIELASEAQKIIYGLAVGNADYTRCLWTGRDGDPRISAAEQRLVSQLGTKLLTGVSPTQCEEVFLARMGRRSAGDGC